MSFRDIVSRKDVFPWCRISERCLSVISYLGKMFFYMILSRKDVWNITVFRLSVIIYLGNTVTRKVTLSFRSFETLFHAVFNIGHLGPLDFHVDYVDWYVIASCWGFAHASRRHQRCLRESWTRRLWIWRPLENQTTRCRRERGPRSHESKAA